MGFRWFYFFHNAFWRKGCFWSFELSEWSFLHWGWKGKTGVQKRRYFCGRWLLRNLSGLGMRACKFSPLMFNQVGLGLLLVVVTTRYGIFSHNCCFVFVWESHNCCFLFVWESQFNGEFQFWVIIVVFNLLIVVFNLLC